MTRWNPKHSLRSTAKAVKRGLTSLFVCAVVLLPIILALLQWTPLFNRDGDPRKLIDMQPIATRQIDAHGGSVKPFEQPLITVTFDDGWESIYTDGMPLLHKYGISTTQYVLSGVSEDRNYLSIEQVKAIQKAGHEIGCHSIDHADLTALTTERLEAELHDCKALYEKELGTRIEHFASPYGRSNAETIDAIRRYYRSHRNTDGDITNGVSDQDVNTKQTFSLYNIHAVTVRRDTTVAELQQAIDYTVQNKGWLVLNYHDVTDTNSEYGLDKAKLEAQLSAISKADARVVTMGQVIDAIAPRNR